MCGASSHGSLTPSLVSRRRDAQVMCQRREKKEELVVTADMPGVGMTRYRDFNGHRRNR